MSRVCVHYVLLRLHLRTPFANVLVLFPGFLRDVDALDQAERLVASVDCVLGGFRHVGWQGKKSELSPYHRRLAQQRNRTRCITQTCLTNLTVGPVCASCLVSTTSSLSLRGYGGAALWPGFYTGVDPGTNATSRCPRQRQVPLAQGPAHCVKVTTGHQSAPIEG